MLLGEVSEDSEVGARDDGWEGEDYELLLFQTPRPRMGNFFP